METITRMAAIAALSSLSISAFAEVTAEPTATMTETVVVQEQVPIDHSEHHQSVLSQLNLSNQQKALVQKIDRQYSTHRPLLNNEDRQLMANLRQERKNLVLNKQFDDSKAKDVIEQEQRIWAQQQQVRADYEFLRLKREHDIYQILTPKQQQQYMRLRQQRKLLR